MPTSRYWCLVAVLSANKLMVVGGQGKDVEYTNKVEIATYVSKLNYAVLLPQITN